MGLFTRNKKIDKTNLPAGKTGKAEAEKSEPVVIKKKKSISTTSAKPILTTASSNVDLASVLRRPRITEKASSQEDMGVYVFEVDPRAGKKIIAEAIKRFYKVTPVKINLAKIPAKKFVSRMRRQWGVKTGGKKAYVYLKKGDKIEIV